MALAKVFVEGFPVRTELEAKKALRKWIFVKIEPSEIVGLAERIRAFFESRGYNEDNKVEVHITENLDYIRVSVSYHAKVFNDYHYIDHLSFGDLLSNNLPGYLCEINFQVYPYDKHEVLVKWVYLFQV